MPRKPLRPCYKHGCHELTRDSYCVDHKDEASKKKAERNKRYDKNNRTTSTFYKGTTWRKVREQAFKRDDGLCQRCLQKDKIKNADVVHHIEEVQENWDRRYDLDNLESVCHACHNREHKGNVDHTPTFRNFIYTD